MQTVSAEPLQRAPQSTDRVREWRYDQLVQAGYPRREAVLLSGLREVDLHQAVDLVEHGCPVETALAILL